jgi:hypothetical protein
MIQPDTASLTHAAILDVSVKTAIVMSGCKLAGRLVRYLMK